MRFSVDQKSIADIVAALVSYSDEIDAEFRAFQDKIKKIAIRTNYNKLLLALQEIVDIYNDTVCGSMRDQLFIRWSEEGESLHAFAEDVYMGEESEEAAKQIESGLKEIFISDRNNDLYELELSDGTHVSKADFDEVVSCFDSFEKEIDSVKETNIRYFTNKIDENELYRFVLPLIDSIAAGISNFIASAGKEVARLGDNYVERMERAKQHAEDARDKAKSMEFDLNLFDFDGSVSGGAGIRPDKPASSVSGKSGNEQSKTFRKETERIPAAVNADGSGDLFDAPDENAAVMTELDKEICALADGMGKEETARHFDSFKKITVLLYDTICEGPDAVKEKLPYFKIRKILPVYKEFYGKYGYILKDRFENPEQRQKHNWEEYVKLTRKKGNDRFYNAGDEEALKSHYDDNYMVFPEWQICWTT